MRFVLPAVVGGHILLISTQVGARPDATLIEAALFGALSQAQRLVTATGVAVRDTMSAVADLRQAQEENLALRADLDAIRIRLHEQRALAHKTAELERLLQLRQTVRWRTVSARVIAAGASPYFRTVTVDRGARDQIQPDHAVIAPFGVVGRIVGPSSRNAAKVQLLIDRKAGAGAYIERTGTAGVVVGTDDASVLQMDYVPSHPPVIVGDVVMTSGNDGIFPPGLPIGVVAAMERRAGASQTIQISPAIDFSRLEHVLIVVPRNVEEAETSLIAGGTR